MIVRNEGRQDLSGGYDVNDWPVRPKISFLGRGLTSEQKRGLVKIVERLYAKCPYNSYFEVILMGGISKYRIFCRVYYRGGKIKFFKTDSDLESLWEDFEFNVKKKLSDWGGHRSFPEAI